MMSSAEPFASWPEPIRSHIHHGYGDPVSIDDVSGMSGGSVVRIRFATTSIVVKHSHSGRECRFYERVAPALRGYGVATPHLLWSTRHGDTFWLLLEDIPAPLAPDRGIDRRVMTEMVRILAHLHMVPLSLFPASDAWFKPHWTDSMTLAALSLFAPEVADECGEALRRIQRECQPLFEPQCWISADPNPLNWGTRADSTLVLFDWERFGQGTPALDLAIIVPGLGDLSAYAMVAADYLAVRGRETGGYLNGTEGLARDISHAKVWTVVDLLSDAAGGAPDDVIAWLVGRVPGWLRELRQARR